MCGYPTDDFLPAALTFIPRLPGSWHTCDGRRDRLSLGNMSHLRKSGVSASGRPGSTLGPTPDPLVLVHRVLLSELRKSPEMVLTIVRKPQRLPDYFTFEEASALVVAAPSYQVWMAMRIMLWTGLRVSECLFLRLTDIRLDRAPSSTCRRAEL